MWISIIANLTLSLLNFLIWYMNKDSKDLAGKLASISLWVSGALFGFAFVMILL